MAAFTEKARHIRCLTFGFKEKVRVVGSEIIEEVGQMLRFEFQIDWIRHVNDDQMN